MTNLDLYRIAKSRLNHLPTEAINSEVIEDHVADAAEYHDEQRQFKGVLWARPEDIADVTEALCVAFKTTFYK